MFRNAHDHNFIGLRLISIALSTSEQQTCSRARHNDDRISGYSNLMCDLRAM